MKKLINLLALLLFVTVSAIAQYIPNTWTTTSGAANVYTVSRNPSIFGTSYTNKVDIIKFHVTNSSTATVNYNSLGAIALRMWDGDSWEPLTAGQIDVNTIYKIAYLPGGNYFQMESFGTGGGGGPGLVDGDYGDWTISGGGTVATIDNNVVTFAKMQAIGANTLLGASGGTAVEQISVGSPLTLISDVLSIQQATTGQNGFLTSTDWNTFNNKQSALTLGTGVTTALAVNVGSAGAFVVNGGALGTPTSGTLNLTTLTLTNRLPEANLTDKYIIDQATASTAGGTITLDLNSQIQRSFVGSATFSAPKTLALSNTTNGMFFNVYLEVTNVAAVLTVPSDWLMSTGDFNGTDWTPPATGKYEFGGSFDDVNNVWYIKVSGPFN